MSAKENILRRVRESLHKDGSGQEAERRAAQAYIQAHAIGPRPQVPEDLVTRFLMRCDAMQTTRDRVAAMAEVPQAVARYLAANDLPRVAVCWPRFAHLDWQAQQISMEARPAAGSDLVGITGTFCAIAETGTLMLLSGPETAATTSLLPETHIAIVPASRIVKYMEDGWQLMRDELGRNPRAVNFVSGPSRTADIENTINVGAHGPYRVHVIVVDE